MYVCVRMYVLYACARMYGCACACVRMDTHTYTCSAMHIRMHAPTYTHAYIHAHPCTPIHSTHMHISMHAHMHTHVHTRDNHWKPMPMMRSPEVFGMRQKDIPSRQSAAWLLRKRTGVASSRSVRACAYPYVHVGIHGWMHVHACLWWVLGALIHAGGGHFPMHTCAYTRMCMWMCHVHAYSPALRRQRVAFSMRPSSAAGAGAA